MKSPKKMVKIDKDKSQESDQYDSGSVFEEINSKTKRRQKTVLRGRICIKICRIRAINIAIMLFDDCSIKKSSKKRGRERTMGKKWPK